MDLDNLDGSHCFMLQWPWHYFVARKIVDLVRTGEGVVSDCKWDNMYYHIAANKIEIPEMGRLELDYTSLVYRPQHDACYFLNMSRCVCDR